MELDAAHYVGALACGTTRAVRQEHGSSRPLRQVKTLISTYGVVE